MHCLFFLLLLLLFFSIYFIEGGTSTVSDDVVELKFTKRAQKFSVKEKFVEFISLFGVSKSIRQIVQRHFSICNALKSCKKEVTRLNDGTICDHLKWFWEYLNQNEELLCANDTFFTSGILPEEKVTHHLQKWHFRRRLLIYV